MGRSPNFWDQVPPIQLLPGKEHLRLDLLPTGTSVVITDSRCEKDRYGPLDPVPVERECSVYWGHERYFPRVGESYTLTHREVYSFDNEFGKFEYTILTFQPLEDPQAFPTFLVRESDGLVLNTESFSIRGEILSYQNV